MLDPQLAAKKPKSRAYRLNPRYQSAQRVRQSQRRQRTRDFIVLAKAKPCADCAGIYPACVMDFDHRPGVAKVANVGKLAANGARLELIKTEIAKCDVVCANCHRIRSSQRRQNKE